MTQLQNSVYICRLLAKITDTSVTYLLSSILQWFCSEKSSSGDKFLCINLNLWIFIFIMNVHNTKGNFSVSERSVLTLRWKLWNLIQSRPLHQTLQPGWWSEGGERHCWWVKTLQQDKILYSTVLFSITGLHFSHACLFIHTDWVLLWILGYRVLSRHGFSRAITWKWKFSQGRFLLKCDD